MCYEKQIRLQTLLNENSLSYIPTKSMGNNRELHIDHIYFPPYDYPGKNTHNKVTEP